MIVLIAGASHTGKTLAAQRLLEKYKFPYLSADHLKMGLIRSGYTDLTPEDDDKLEAYIWPVLREIIKTAVENGQNLTIEGCYIPFDWKKDFEDRYLKEIRYYSLVMSRSYIENHFSDIKNNACAIERRADDSWCTIGHVTEDNAHCLEMCLKHGCNYILIDKEYNADIEL